jgi:hypothetical protein
MVFPRNYFNDGNYTFDLWVQHKLNVLRNLVDLESPVFFEILPEKRDLGAWMGKEEGFIRQVFEWNQID